MEIQNGIQEIKMIARIILNIYINVYVVAMYLYIKILKVLKSQVQFNFVECLAHVEITVEKKSGFFSKAKGYFEHNEECKKALRIAPSILNIHLLVKQMALDLLTLNASSTQILNNNQKFVEQKCQSRVIIDN